MSVDGAFPDARDTRCTERQAAEKSVSVGLFSWGFVRLFVFVGLLFLLFVWNFFGRCFCGIFLVKIVFWTKGRNDPQHIAISQGCDCSTVSREHVFIFKFKMKWKKQSRPS